MKLAIGKAKLGALFLQAGEEGHMIHTLGSPVGLMLEEGRGDSRSQESLSRGFLVLGDETVPTTPHSRK